MISVYFFVSLCCNLLPRSICWFPLRGVPFCAFSVFLCSFVVYFLWCLFFWFRVCGVFMWFHVLSSFLGGVKVFVVFDDLVSCVR